MMTGQAYMQYCYRPTLNGKTYEMKYDNPILRLTFQFSLDIIVYTEQLYEIKKFVITRQLLKAGTSIGANCREAQNAENKFDFIHKLKIAVKETEETIYWLQLCDASSHYPSTQHLLIQVEQIHKMLNKIIGTTKSNLKTNGNK